MADSDAALAALDEGRQWALGGVDFDITNVVIDGEYIVVDFRVTGPGGQVWFDDRNRILRPRLRTHDGTFTTTLIYQHDTTLELRYLTAAEFAALPAIVRNRHTQLPGTHERPNYVVAPRLALLRDLFHTAKLVTKDWTVPHVMRLPDGTFRGDTLTVFATEDGYITSSHATLATARAGSSLVVVTSNPNVTQAYFTGAVYQFRMSLLAFDTSALGVTATITGAIPSLAGTGTAELDGDGTNIEIKYHDYGAGDPTTADWFDLAGWNAKVNVATMDLTSWDQTADAYNALTDAGNANAQVAKTGVTRMAVGFSNFQTGTPGATGSTFNSRSSEQTGTTSDPKLVITYTPLTTYTRTVPASANLLVRNTRTVPATANMLVKSKRTVPASANVSQRFTRTVPASGDVSVVGPTVVRVAPVSANIKVTNQRSVPVSGAILAEQPYLPPANAQQVADALAGRYGPVALRFRYTRRSRTNAVIDDISSAVTEPGTVTLDNERAVVRDATFEFDAAALPADFNALTDIIGVAVEVYVAAATQWVSMPLGLFVLDETELTYHAGGRQVLTAKGSDLTMLLVRSIRTGPYTVPAGTNHVAAVEAVLSRHGLAHGLAQTTDVAAKDWVWPGGTSDYEICRDLLFGINKYSLWPDRDGVFRSGGRYDPDVATVSVVYTDTAEPRMVSGRDVYSVALDRKQINRVSVVLDDPRWLYVDGSMRRENVSLNAVNSTASLAYGAAVAVESSSADNPVLITTVTPHGFGTDTQVVILGHSGQANTGGNSAVNGTWPITVISPTTFTIPQVLTTGGAGGTAQATIAQVLELKGDSDPSTKCVINELMAGGIATFELRWAATLARQTQLATFLDPRREPHEFYSVELQDIQTEGLLTNRFAVLGWSMQLAPGAIMSHQLGYIVDVNIADIVVHSGQVLPGEV